MKILISAGGTGGHIYPALAIVRAFKKYEKNLEVLYVGTKDRMESRVVPNEGIDYIGIEMKGLNRKNPFKNISVLSTMMKNISFLKKKIKEFNPDIVIGAGGYVTFPVLYAAHKCGVKTAIHEQNSIPGLTNKLLSHYVDRVFTSLPMSDAYFKSNNVIYTGNPRSEEVVRVLPAKKKDYGLKEDKKTVVIVMGSLGSMTINNKFKEILPAFKNKDYEVLFVTGKDYFDDFKDIKVSNVKIVPFLDNMLGVLKFSDLIVSRAGASMISEITTCGLPSILIPSPYVTNNHQYKNAEALEKVNACKILEEKDLEKDKLLTMIDDILQDKVLYDKMVRGNKSLGVKTSATKIYEEIKKLLKED